jgi:Uma2 family endonuclease
VASEAVPERRRATIADVEALPDHVVGEIIGGELVVSPRPAPAHAESSSALGVVLGGPFRFGIGGPGGWWIIDEPELRLGLDPEFEAVVPDLAGWRRERMPALPETAWFGVAPDWVCEVLSPGSEALDRAGKMPFYARAGVRHAWLVDPLVRTLEVYRAVEGPAWLLLGTFRESAIVRAEPFDAIELKLEMLWGR